MRSALVMVVRRFSLASLVALCACGAPPVAKQPEVAIGTDVNGNLADDEHQEIPEVGKEGDDPTPPPESGTAVKPATGPGSAGLIAEANRQLGLKSSSVYSHKTHVDEAHGAFEYDCSGFVDYALANAAPDALATLRKASAKRPLAKDFVSFVGSLPASGTGRWHRVAHAADLVPGDIVAWLEPSDSTSKSTGHVMIVHGAVAHVPALPLEIDVPVVDSTASRHGKGDSRPPNASGLGTGAIILIVDAAGAPIHYRWTRGKNAKEHTSTIVLAHLE